MKKLWKISRK